ncbi:MAG: hypothetical protein KKI15_01665, partial [Proteobacteria bacterium]|nr:hypothetical protein [Pseudomonadota bacterium]
SIQVENDVPELSAMEEPLTVYEDGLDTAAGDESDGIGGGVTDVTINLASLVADGADEDVTYTLLDNLSYQPTGLTSDGKQVSYSVTGNVLTAATVDNTVFTFTLDPLTGNAVFDLIDQLDHTGAGDDEMLSINDLGQFVQVEDADGDVKDFSGLLSIQVENDVPQLVPIIATMAVQEDALGHDYPDVDNAENNVDADFALGNIDETGDTDQASYDLSALVETGADEELRWSLINPYDEGGEASYASQYTSQGQTVYYHLVEGTIIATTSSTAPVSLDVENIFTFSVDEVTGEATFNLNDQLNHPDGSGDEANLTIDDLGQFVRATDSDGDSVDLDDKIHIDVENDVPETAVTGVQYFVSEYAGYDNIIGTYELDENGNPINPGILIGSTNEAAGAGMGENEHSVGEWVEGTKVFLIADGGNQLGDLTNATLGFAETGATDGSPAYVLTIDGIPSAVPVYYMDVALNADGQEHFKDENGNFLNEVPAEGGEIRIEDLSLGDADYDDTVLRVETGLVVDEANLPNGTDPNSALLTVHGNILTGEGMLQIMPGADEPGTLTVTSQIINPENTGAVIPGSEQTIFLDGDHSQSITVSSEAGTLVVYGDGEWEYTLTNNTLMHPDNDPGGHDNSDGDSDRGAQDQVQDIFNLIYEDTDGDTVTPQIIININDDGPEIGEPQFAILANEAGTSLVADLAIDFGADEAGTMNLNPHMDNIGEENTVLDNNGEVMTYQGHALHWLQNPDGSWSAVADMKHEDDEHEDDYGDRSSTTETQNPLPIFTVALEEDSGGVYTGNYTVILHEELDGGQSNEEFSLDFTKGGGHSTNREFVRGDVRINITAEDPDGADPGNVNWSGQGMGVGNAFINEDTDKVQGEDVPLGSEVLIFNFTGTETGEVFLLNSATFGLDHLDHYDQGADDDIPEVAIWTAYGYEADGVTETVVGTGEVTGQLQGSTWKSDQELTIDENNTSGGFYRVEFTAETTNPEGYRVTQLDGSYEESTPQDVTLSFVVDGEDADGDAFDQQTFDVTFDGEGDIVGTDADEVIVGSSDDDVIYGGGGDDMIFGGEGTDEIYGEDGDDTLLGGTEDPPVDPTDPPEEGDDIIFGGDGADTFDTSEEDAGEVQDYEPDPPPVGDDDELADLVPPVIP